MRKRLSAPQAGEPSFALIIRWRLLRIEETPSAQSQYDCSTVGQPTRWTLLDVRSHSLRWMP